MAHQHGLIIQRPGDGPVAMSLPAYGCLMLTNWPHSRFGGPITSCVVRRKQYLSIFRRMALMFHGLHVHVAWKVVPKASGVKLRSYSRC